MQKKLKKSWRYNAIKSLEILLESPFETEFDALIFGDKYQKVLDNDNVSFAEVPDSDLQVIRASRLKMLGYKYSAKNKTWVSGERGEGCRW